MNNYKDGLGPGDTPYPRRISIEYSEEAEDWPFVLVQVRPGTMKWTGIMPDEVVDAGTEDAPVYKLIRQGYFEATCMLQIMATESQTRDRIWDNLVSMLLMARKRNATKSFYTELEKNQYVGITIMEGSVRNVGDTVSMGTPWNPELLTYEAAIEFDMVGTFYGDEYNEDLVPLSTAMIYEYIQDVEQPPLEEDLGTFSASLVNMVPSSANPVADIKIDTEVPDYLINSYTDVEIEGVDYSILTSQLIAQMGNEKLIVLMIGHDGDEKMTCLRVARGQFDTIPVKHKVGTTFKHIGTNWNTWMP